MRWNKLILLWLALLLPTAWYAGAQSGEVSFEVVVPNRIVAGEPFQVQFVLNRSGKEMKMPAPEGLQVLYGPATTTSSNITIINGKRTQSRATTFTYTLLADKEGSYQIPSASVQVGSATYRSKAQRIKVFSQEAAAQSNPSSGTSKGVRLSGEDIFITASINKQTVYEQEPILVTFKLYSQPQPSSIPNVKLPEFDGFVRQEVESDGVLQLNAEEVKGKIYNTVVIYRALLFPQRAGDLVIPSGDFDISVVIPVDDPVEDFFSSFRSQYQEVTKKVKSQPLKVKVKPLPEPRPLGFKGAVGSFKLTAEVPEKLLKTNESFKVQLRLEGSGNLKLAPLPEPEWPEGFESYDPKDEEQIALSGGTNVGYKTREYYAVPRFVGDFTIPEIPFVYFDPATAQYKTITIPEIKLHVDKGEGDASTAIAGFTGREEVKYLGQDIRYLKSNKWATRYHASPISSLAMYLGLMVLLFVVAYFISKRLEQSNANTALNRSRRAGKKARKYLRTAREMQRKGEASAYYDALLRGLNHYLSDKLHLPLSELSKEGIRAKMSGVGYSEETITATLETLGQLEMNQYAPAREQEAKEELYQRASTLIDQLETHRSFRRR